MAVVVLLNHDNEAPVVVRWAAHFARARECDLVVLNVARRPGQARVQDLDLEADDEASPLVQAVRATLREPALRTAAPPDEAEPDADQARPPLAVMRQVQSPDPLRAALRELAEVKARLLIIPRHAQVRQDADTGLEGQLFRRAPCDTMHLRPGQSSGERCQRILAPAAGGPHSLVALRLAHDVCRHNHGQMTVLYVEPPLGGDAKLVGERIITRIVTKVLGSDLQSVSTRVVLGRDVYQGIAEAISKEDDLLLVGASQHGVVRRMMFSTISDRLLAREEGSTVAVVRAAVPLTSRFQQAVEHRLRHIVPQLQRADRVTLTERIQSSSQWNFDFVSLMCLSTLIAALGLVANSVAVVIGAMLVAPLMTPLLGVGLAVVQGNVHLLKLASRTIALAFLISVAISAVVGALVADVETTSEMAQRGSPRDLDLLVAFASGLAAAYAIGRPNLLSALPGVAIAAALVPPVATSGLGLALGDFDLAGGAALLFLTNIVAIVLGTAVSFWTVGIRAPHTHGQRRHLMWKSVVAFLVVGVALIFALR